MTEATFFYGNPDIQLLGKAARWTVSGRLDADSPSGGKAPIDIRHLLTGCNPGCLHPGPLRGAWATDEQCLVALDELTEAIPNAANNAFYLKAITDGLMVIDIEPTCPPEVAANLLALPQDEILYAEVSMSGRGYHLLTPLPENFYDHPVGATKTVLRHEQGWYEILLRHWVTFTRRPLDEESLARVAAVDLADAPFASVADVFADLARDAKPSAASMHGAVCVAEEAPEIKGADEIVAGVVAAARPRLKTLDDFDNDTSRWEFSVLGILARQMRPFLVRIGFQTMTTYSASDRAWLLYLAAREVIPNRPKHHERRNGRPFLLHRAAEMVALYHSERTAA